MSFTCEELDYLDSKAESEAALIRQRIEATVVRRVPQVMVKVTGGGRGMKGHRCALSLRQKSTRALRARTQTAGFGRSKPVNFEILAVRSFTQSRPSPAATHFAERPLQVRERFEG